MRGVFISPVITHDPLLCSLSQVRARRVRIRRREMSRYSAPEWRELYTAGRNDGISNRMQSVMGYVQISDALMVPYLYLRVYPPPLKYMVGVGVGEGVVVCIPFISTVQNRVALQKPKESGICRGSCNMFLWLRPNPLSSPLESSRGSGK